MSILAFLLAAQTISSEPLDRDRYRLHVNGRITSIEAAQAALVPTARRLCGTRTIIWGTFRSSRGEALAKEATGASSAQPSFDQELLCGTGRTVNLAAIRNPKWAPAPEDQEAVLAATYAYFAAKDRGHYADAWARLSKRMKEASPATEWRRAAKAFNLRSGPVQARRVTEITWLNNPPDAPQPGLFIAADFSAEFEKLDFVCGYVMWLLQPDGSLVLTREEQNLLERATAKTLASIDRAPLRAQMGCKD